MGDAARSLDREPERRRGAACPVRQDGSLRHLVEGVVDLHRRQPLAVELQHPLRLHVLRVEAAFPFLERIAACAGEKLERAHDFVLSAAWRTISSANTPRSAGSLLRRNRPQAGPKRVADRCFSSSSVMPRGACTTTSGWNATAS